MDITKNKESNLSETKLQIFSRQYLITNDATLQVNDWNKNTSQDAQIFFYTHPLLDITIIKNQDRELFLLGYILDPFHPDWTNQDILKELSLKDNFEALVEALFTYSGRYIILYKTDAELKILHDALGQQEVYYHFNHDKFYLVKQPIFLNQYLPLVRRTDESYWNIVNSEKFKILENAFYGDETAYSNVFHLLPNHFLDLRTQKKQRYFPNFPLKKIKFEESLETVIQLIQGTIDAATNRFSLYMGFTGGGDSRVCVSATRHYIHKMKKFFVNQYPHMTDKTPDIWVPKHLATKTQLPFQVNLLNNSLNQVPKEFIELYQKSYDFPILKFIPTHYNLYNFLKNDTNVAISMAHGTGILGNSFFEIKNVTAAQLAQMVSFPKNDYVTNVLDNWLQESRACILENNFYVKNILYWEQRCGNWAVQSTTQGDVYRETVYPFNNRALLTTQLSYTFAQNNTPFIYEKFTSMLIRKMWSELMTAPINPAPNFKNKVKSILKNNYFSQKLKQIIFQLKS